MASLPYIHIPTFHVGPREVTPFGIIVASGILLAMWMANKYAERNGLDDETTRWLGFRLVVWGFLACHVFNTLFYEWNRFLDDPLLMLKVWDGISSWGGIIGGALALTIYARIKKLDRMAWGDWAAYGAIGGWMPGRFACVVAHDHVGYPTDFPLAVDFPPGTYWFDLKAEVTIRAHDLGLYEFFGVVLPLFIIILLLERKKPRRPGLLLGVLAVGYSVPRFFLEFLRRVESDPRYFGLTFAQYCCIIGLVAGIWLLFRKPRPAPATPVEPATAEPAGKKSSAK